MQIQFIRHATLLVHTSRVRFLVDPMLSPAESMVPSPNTVPQRKNPLVQLPSQISLETLQTADAVLLTHTHRDHWDDAAVRLLPHDLPIFCQPEDSETVRDAGFTDVTALTDPVLWNGVRITRTGAKHGVGDMAEKMGPVTGFVLESEGEPSLYITGDTVWCDEVKLAIQQKQPDVIVAFAGAAEFTSGGPITMTAADVHSLSKLAPDSRTVAVHMEAWNHCALRRNALRAYLDEHGVGEQVCVPNDGDTLTFRLTDFR